MVIICLIFVMMLLGLKVILLLLVEKKNEDCNIYVVLTLLYLFIGKLIKKFTNFFFKINYLFNKINYYMYLIFYIKRSNFVFFY